MTGEDPVGSGPPQLKRQVGVGGAVVLGLGSIVGTGVFVSIGIAAGVIGPGVIAAIAVAAMVATCNGLSSAQLAANHPQSGGTYEYGHRWLVPWVGFVAGWMFLCAKSASAATAALGVIAYARRLGVGTEAIEDRWLALAVVLGITLLVLFGLKRSNRINTVLVVSTVFTLLLFVACGIGTAVSEAGESLVPFWRPAEGTTSAAAFAEACALMFVAYTGYGRIATMGEEIEDPRRKIPRAMIATLVISMVLYITVAVVGVSAAGVEAFAVTGSGAPAPLEQAAGRFGGAGLAWLVAGGAVLAMLGVLLNLVLGLSRVALAMGRRGDLPSQLAKLDARGESPTMAVVAVGVLIAAMTALGDVRTTWSFSAFAVLVYYSLTNLAALRLSKDERLYPAWISALGLVACGFLAFWVDREVWLTGLGVMAGGLVLRPIIRSVYSRS